MDQTTPYHRNGTFLAPVVTFTMLLGVGTGGDYTYGYHELRKERFAFSKSRDEGKLPGGQSLLEAISSGVDGAEAARTFVEMYRTESEQRRLLNERLANRGAPSRSVLTLANAPSL